MLSEKEKCIEYVMKEMKFRTIANNNCKICEYREGNSCYANIAIPFKISDEEKLSERVCNRFSKKGE